MKGGGHAFAALSVGSRAVGKRKTLDAIWSTDWKAYVENKHSLSADRHHCMWGIGVGFVIGSRRGVDRKR
jgi:hypothetical protein